MNRALTCLMTAGRTLSKRYNSLTTFRPVRAIQSSYSFSFNRKPKSELFLDHENLNAHNLMANDPAYNDTIINAYVQEEWPIVTDKQFHVLITQDFSSKTPDEICDDFQKITVYTMGKEFNIVDTVFDGLRNKLIAILPDVTDHQLLCLLKLIPLWKVKNAKDPVFYQLWSQFDKQCIERYKKWSLNKMLLFMDCWYLMKLSRISNFVWLAIRKLAFKPSRLTPKQLVQTMFYANTNRKCFPTLPMYDIEQEICSYYNDFNIRELGIVSLGFFKTQTPIRNQELVKNMYISVINEIQNINSIELAAFLKIFRYCTKHTNADLMYKLMDHLVNKVDDVQMICCTHMALLGTNLLIKHEDLLKRISQRVVNEISQARIKDIERLTLALTMLNYNPRTSPCIFETVIKELRSDSRNIDFETYTTCYLSTLTFLAVFSIFPYDCISKSLEHETLKKCFGKKLSKFSVPRDIICLNNSLLIECPDYTGPLLPDTLRVSCNNHLAWHIPTSNISIKENINDRIFKKLYKQLMQLFKNESYLHACYVLPHHPKCDIIFCIDGDGYPVVIPESIKNKITFNEFQKLPDLGTWFAVIMLVRNSILYYSNEYNGLTVCKIRQLKKLGYEPVPITTKELEIYDNQKLLCEKLKIYNIKLK